MNGMVIDKEEAGYLMDSIIILTLKVQLHLQHQIMCKSNQIRCHNSQILLSCIHVMTYNDIDF